MIRKVLLAALLAAGAAHAAAAAEPEKAPAILFTCRERIANPGGISGALSLEKRFREDGSVRSFTASLEDWQGSFVRARAGRAMATLRWPGEHRFAREGVPFDPTDGSVKITFLGDDGGYHRFLKNERWRQVVVDRNRSVMVHDTDGMRTLFLNGFEMWLTSELTSLSSPGLNMSVDGLLAWGTGTDRLTVYETLVQRRRYRKNVYPNSPAGRMRVVAEYEIDVAALRRSVDTVREAARGWEAELGDFRTKCERDVEDDGNDIILT